VTRHSTSNTKKKVANNYESTGTISEEQGLIGTNKASHQQTLTVVSEEQETSVLSPTRTASLTCKNKNSIYKLCIQLYLTCCACSRDCAGVRSFGYNLNANETGFWTLGGKVKVEE